MKLGKKILIFAAGAAVFAAAGTFVLSRNFVQKFIAISYLENFFEAAEIEKWDSKSFKNFSLGNVKISLGNDAEIFVECAEIKISSVFDAIFGNVNFEISVPEILLKKDIFAVRFSENDWKFSQSSGTFFSNFSLQKNGENFHFGNAKFSFENSKKIFPKIFGNELINFLCGIENGNAEIFEKLNSEALGNAENDFREIGKFSLRRGILDGNFDLDLSIFENVFPLKISGNSSCKISGNVEEMKISFEPSYDFSVAPVAEGFPALKIFLTTNSFSNLGFRGNSKFVFFEKKVVAEEFSAEIFAEIPNENPVNLAEISLTKKVAISLGNDGEITVSADSESTEKIANLSFSGTPLFVLVPALDDFWADNFSSFSFGEETISGALDLNYEASGTLKLNSSEALKISGIVSFGHEKISQNVIFEIAPEVTFFRGKIEVVVPEGKIFHEENSASAERFFDGIFNFSANTDLSFSKVDFSAGFDLNENFAFLCQSDFFENFKNERKFSSKSSLRAAVSEEDFELEFFEFSISDKSRERPNFFFTKLENLALKKGNSWKMLLEKPFKIEASEFPLELLNSFTGKFSFAGTLSGNLLASCNFGKVEFGNDEGGEIRNFSMSKDGEILLENLSLSSGKSFVSVGFDEFGKCQTIVKLSGSQLKNFWGKMIAEGDLFLSIYGTSLEEIRGNVCGEIVEIFSQPLLENVEKFSSGTFFLKAGINARKNFGTLKLDLFEISLAENPEISLEKISLEFAHLARENEAARLKLEFLGNGESEIRVKFPRLDFDFETRNLEFSAKIFSPKLEISDAVFLVGIFNFLKSEASGTPKNFEENSKFVPAEKNHEIASNPFVNEHSREREISGTADFSFKDLKIFGAELGEFFGDFELSAEKFLTKFSSKKFLSGTLDGNAKILNSQKNASADFEVFFEKSEIAEVFKAFSGNEISPITGTFKAKIFGKSVAEKIDEISQKIVWNAEISGENGRVRALKFGGEKFQFAEEIAAVGGGLVGIFGGIAEKASPRASKVALAFQDLQKNLSDFSFENCFVEAAGSAEQIHFGKIFVQGELLKIFGSGEIFPDENLAFPKWDSEFLFQINARGNLAEILEMTKLGGGGNDESGFKIGPRLRISGPLEEITSRAPEILKGQ